MTALNRPEPPFETALPPHQVSLARSAFRSPALWVFSIFVLVAVFAPFIAPFGPTEITRGGRETPPSIQHLFGTDSHGMDVFSRVLFGARKDLFLPLVAATISMAVGTLLGLVAGYLGGWLDSVLQRAVEVLQAFPVVVLAIAILLALGPSLSNVVAVIAFIGIPVYFRVIRAVILPMRHAEFVMAARCGGHGSLGIMVRHLLPNAWAPIIAQFTISFAIAIQALAGLSFLGLGIRVPEPEWGLMVNQGSIGVIRGVWWVSFFPGLAIFLTVLTLNRIGAWIERAGRIR